MLIFASLLDILRLSLLPTSDRGLMERSSIEAPQVRRLRIDECRVDVGPITFQ